ncbi:MAG TPA: hypothetical protein DF383_09580, partial [Deltaproteobacteria bacterium]|nr:hypothetical protein [Deltaproteobacteria bacterium]
MFVAHLPAGYLGTRAFLRLFKKPAACRGDSSKDKDLTPKFFLAVGLLGSVFPDLDLIYFYTLDHRQHLHHSYWVHIPVYWLAVFGLGWLGCSLFRRPTLVLYFAVFCANVFLHLFLDTL